MRVEMLLLIIGAGLSAVSQLLLKISANRNSADGAGEASGAAAKAPLMQRFRAQYLNPFVIGGYALLLVAMVIPLYALKFIDMKYAAIIESLGYVFIMVLSAAVLRERITRRLVAGIALIVAGVIVFGSHIIM
ncbi:MAG: EamA family transporter [Clostridiales Family XIII bacterium]|jgi:drug/metabolite transporter (DMT)-like permease|nr:EamA family transporter [Clostridiales Family XIII bacterium]